ncbi:MAG: bifunctional oligoribonuclease/PAP phosphatase NrnA [Acidobacteria bacterium]|nr:bifunctional oligoribonuclease/PAP phosphatase NrnA [Acidobacteriota bacterium]
MLDRFAAFLDSHGRILISSHENPDGDGVGTALALFHLLRARGKEARIVVHPHLPPDLAWLDPGQAVEPFDPSGRHKDLSAWPDAWLVVDASEVQRLGPLRDPFHASAARKACLDHHLKDAPAGFDEEFTDPAASASAELVYRLLDAGEPRPWSLSVCTALYVGIVSDTGNFQFSNSTAAIHRAAADLIDQGVRPARAYQQLFWQERPQKLRLFGRAFQGLELLEGGAYARLQVTLADLAACGADHDDLDRLVNKPLELAGVEVSVLLYEARDGRIKVSLRSRERVDVNAVARRFGGGGHTLASGARLETSLAEASRRVDEAVVAQVRSDLPP